MMAIHNASSVKGTDRWSTASPEASEQSDAAEFAGAVAAAEVVAAQAGQPKAPEVLSPDVPHQVGDVKAQAAGKLDKILPRSAGGSAESASQIQKMAVSSNTGVDIAGLKPWSPDWVFEGGMNQHPAQKTLVGGQEGGESATAVSELEQLLRQSGAVMADSSDKRSAPVEGAGQSMNRPALSKSTKSSSALAGDDFLGMRQVSTATKSVKPSLGAPQGVPGPEVGPRIPGEMTPVSERKQERMKLPDTLGLLHPTGDKPDSRANVLPFEAGASALRLDGGVVAGSMSKDRLTTESVSGIAQSIRQLSNGGEVRIRLKPDHLGELHLKVTTGGKTGSDVGLQIQASDSRAKKILEESLGSLRESLASQNLSLARVEVQVAHPSASFGAGNDSGSDRPGLSGQQNFSSNSGDGNRGSSTREGSGGSEDSSMRSKAASTPRHAAAFGGGGSMRSVASNRIDVIA